MLILHFDTGSVGIYYSLYVEVYTCMLTGSESLARINFILSSNTIDFFVIIILIYSLGDEELLPCKSLRFNAICCNELSAKISGHYYQ